MCRKLTCLVSLVLALGVTASTTVAELVAYYPLDEGTGTTTADASGKGHDGTLHNGATWISPGYFGNSAINVDGNTGSRVAIGTWDPSEGTGQLSLALWVKWSGEQDKSDHQGLIGKRDAWADSGAMRWFWEVRNDGRIHLRNFSQGVAAPAGTLDPFINKWAHVAVTFDGTTARIYLNGVEEASGEFSLHDKTDAAMGIGSTHGGVDWSEEVFSGDLDEVYIFSEAVSQSQIQDLAMGITPTFPKARGPKPEDGTTIRDKYANMSWSAGDGAASHNVYFGDNFADVEAGTGGTFQRNQTDLSFLVGFPGYPYPDGLVEGTTYYWRIDEFDGMTTHKGDVWSFFVSPRTAYAPSPLDGAALVNKDVTLSWEAGFDTVVHHVYFGDSLADVQAGTPDTYRGEIIVATYTPGTLELEKTYYWRVDEFDGMTTHTGDVWSFTTTGPGLGTVVLEVWENITGSSVDDLRNDPRYPAQPDSTEQLTELAWDPDMDTYGGRIHGWLYVPLTGDYTFWVTSDNDSEFWLSTDDDPENAELTASMSGWAGTNEWTKFDSQKSDPVSLMAGNRYYVMALWKEQDGGDHCRVAWQGPGISTRTIISGSYLSPYEPVKAYGPNPVDGAEGVTQTPVLRWKQGERAAWHQVYFGTDEDAVKNATTASSEYKDTQALGNESYDPGELAWESTYYWRIDEVNGFDPDGPWTGTLWSFTTADFAVVDDLEQYDTDNAIWANWVDGLGYITEAGVTHPGNSSGSEVGDPASPSYTEEVVVHGGSQSMPYWYNNNKPPDPVSGQTYSKYSEAKLTLSGTRNWTEEGVKALSLWLQGHPASIGSFVESPPGTYTMVGSGTDITGPSDEFHYAYKMLNGQGTIVARVESVQNTNGWAKAGVMIRETLEADSAHAMAFVTPGNGAVFEYRPAAGQDNLGNAGQQTGVAAPYWVKLERSIAGTFTASHSSDGSTWQVLGTPPNVQMNANVYVGLALTSHDAALTCEAVFSNVTITGNVGVAWTNQDIGIQSNDPEPMYVAIANSAGAPAVVYHDDADAAQIGTWTEWNIDLKEFQDKGINLTDVNSIAIGFGNRNNPQAGGAGKMYFDDIRLYRPRQVPGKGTPRAGDINSDGIVDYLDLEIMAGDWGEQDYTIDPTVDPTTANLVAYYSLDEGAGTTAGDSTGANNGIVVGGAQWTTGPDAFGGALLFDGTGSQYVDLGTWNPSAGTGQLTISLWANWNGISGQYMGLIGKRDAWAADDMMWQIEAAQSNGNVNVSRESGQTVGGFIPEIGEWEHIAFAFDGTTGTLYRNGKQVSSAAWSLGPDTESAMVFGACQANGGNPYNGALDEVRMYNRALSEAEIAYLVANGSATLYVPVFSDADLYDVEPQGSKAVNFKDYAILVDQWLEEQLWPEW